jgi:hypothetical protein
VNAAAAISRRPIRAAQVAAHPYVGVAAAQLGTQYQQSDSPEETPSFRRPPEAVLFPVTDQFVITHKLTNRNTPAKNPASEMAYGKPDREGKQIK